MAAMIVIIYMLWLLLWVLHYKFPYRSEGRLTILPLLLAAAPAVYQLGKGLLQKRQAKKLKESTFVPKELTMNRDLATQQAYSRRAPGQAVAEENVRRATANQISAGQRLAGGNINKSAAITSAATAQADDANRSIAAQGQSFSEGAFNRLGNANNAIAGQKRANRDAYTSAKAALLGASDQNIFNSVNNLSTAGLIGAEGAGSGYRPDAADAIGGQLGAMAKKRNSASGYLQSRFMQNPYYGFGQQNQMGY